MDFMSKTLLWLASPATIDLKAANTIDLIKNILYYSAEQHKSILDTTLFDNEFFGILELIYKTYLQAAMLTFGQDRRLDGMQLSQFIVTEGNEEEKDALKKRGSGKVIEIIWDRAYETYIKEVCTPAH